MLNFLRPPSTQLAFFGVEYQSNDPSRFVVPIEAVVGFYGLSPASAFASAARTQRAVSV